MDFIVTCLKVDFFSKLIILGSLLSVDDVCFALWNLE